MSEIQNPRWPHMLHVALCTTLHTEADSRVWSISSWCNCLILLVFVHNYATSGTTLLVPPCVKISSTQPVDSCVWVTVKLLCDLEYYFGRQENLKTRLNSVTAMKSHFLTFDWRWSCWKHILSLSKLLSGHPSSLYHISFSPTHTTMFCLRQTQHH